MPVPSLTYPQLKALMPCTAALRAVARKFGGAKKWGGREITAKQAVKAGVSFGDLLWAAISVALRDEDIKRRIALWQADCCARVLWVFEKEHPTDMRPRKAVTAKRQWARGKISSATLNDALCEARKAAATTIRSGAHWAALATFHSHAADTAFTASSAASAPARAASWADWNAERKWQFDRLVMWLGDPEPKVWPLPRKKVR